MRIPKMSLHASGQYRVRFKQQAFYLGKDKQQAERRYRELVASHYGAMPADVPSYIKVSDLIESYITHQLARCDERWRKMRQDTLHQATRHAIELYGKMPASAFGPLALQQVRRKMAEVPGRSRSYINGLCSKLKSAFKWGVSQELVRQTDYQRLLSVPGLEAGELGLKDKEERKPVDLFLVERTLPYLTDRIADIIRLLLLTGARPDEIVRLKPSELERGEVWIYHPRHHKTAKKNKRRAIVLGTDAKAILLRHWPQDDGYFFTGDKGGHLGVAAIRLAVIRACDRASLPRWHPYQIRHRVITDIALRLGREYAQAVAGHSNIAMTATYDHATIERAKKAVG